MRRLRVCVEAWPDCHEGGYDPSCCRFPKSCSCTVYDPERVTEVDLEPGGDDTVSAETPRPPRGVHGPATMNCGTCRHWRRADERWPFTEDDVPWGSPLHAEGNEAALAAKVAEQQNRWGKCEKVTHGWGDSERAYTMDASQYASSLHCRDDFGCVEFEAVEP